MILWPYIILILSLISPVSCASTNAQTNQAKPRALSKVGPELAALYDEYSAALASGKTAGFRSTNPLVRVIDGRVVIDAVASDDVNVLKTDLSSLGMQQAVAFGRIVSGQLPISAIPSLAALSSLNSARAASAMLQGGH